MLAVNTLHFAPDIATDHTAFMLRQGGLLLLPNHHAIECAILLLSFDQDSTEKHMKSYRAAFLDSRIRFNELFSH